MKMTNGEKQIAALCCGLLGCLCFGARNWMMMYGDPKYTGSVYWLTEGVVELSINVQSKVDPKSNISNMSISFALF